MNLTHPKINRIAKLPTKCVADAEDARTSLKSHPRTESERLVLEVIFYAFIFHVGVISEGV